jgi:serine protease Do
MKKSLKAFIAQHKTTILVSVVSSIATFVVLIGLVFGLVFYQTGSLAFEKLINRTHVYETVVTDGATEQSLTIDAIEKSSPAVVSIIITKDVPIYDSYSRTFDPFGYLFGYGNNTMPEQRGTELQEIGGGSGFFISADGYIVTNNHVVSDADANYTVLTKDGDRFSAEVLATDSIMDVAILKVDGNNFPYLKFADSDKLLQGQTVIAIGNALAEYQNSVSRGIISGLKRSIIASDSSGNQSEQLDNIIQTDAAINPGNSGGPLLDINGNVIGVNVAVQQSAENIGFALPGNMVKSIVDSVVEFGEIVRPYLGIRYTQVDSYIQEQNDLSVDYGVLLAPGSDNSEPAVVSGSPADKAGLKEGDVILEVDGTKLDDSLRLANIIRQKKVDQEIKIKILRDGNTYIKTIKLEKAPNN